MQINVRVNKLNKTDSKVVALASVTLGGVFAVHDIKVINGENGLFVAMPSRKKSNGEFVDIAHPVTAKFRQELMDKVLEEYNKA